MKTYCHIDPQVQLQLLQRIDDEAQPLWREELSRSVPQILELVAESHEMPIEHQTRVIREILVEHCRIGPAGQPVRLDEHELQRHVDLLVRHLEDLRRSQVQSGSWSDAPMPEQCFG